MKNIKSVMLKYIVLILAGLLLVSLTFAFSGAWYGTQKDGKGEFNFNKGIYADITNLDAVSNSEGILKYYPNGNESETAVNLTGVEAEQNESYIIAKPQIVAKEGTYSFFARAKFEYKFYVEENNELIEKTAEELGTTNENLKFVLFDKTLTFINSRWVESSDGFFYYVKYGSKATTKETLQVITENQTIDILDSNCLALSDWNGVSGGPFGICKFEIVLKIDLIEESAIDNWVVEPFGLLDLTKYKITDQNGTEINANSDLVANLTYCIVDRETGSGYKFAYSESGIQKVVRITGVYGSPTDLEICGSILWNGEYYFSNSVFRQAFKNNTTLISVKFLSGIKTIEGQAFYGCDNLTQIALPQSLIEIYEQAFYNCKSLKTIEIPENVIHISWQVLLNCTSLESIIISKGNTTFDSRDNCLGIINTETNTLVFGFEKTKIPESVTSIGRYAFYGCENLTNLTLPESIQTIGESAFSGCVNLQNFNLPNSLVKIDKFAFENCKSLTSVLIPKKVNSIGFNPFRGCSSLEEICVENGNEKYYSSDENENYNAIIVKASSVVYSGCKNTMIPQNAKSISSYCFSGCDGLYAISLPSTLTSIGSYAFYDCINLQTVQIPNGVSAIYACTFHNCANLQTIEVPNSVSSFGEYAFYNCKKLETINIPEGVTKLSQSLFWYCESLNNITIPSTVTTIEGRAFAFCRALEAINIPIGVTTIGSVAFEDCVKITSIEIPNTVTSIGMGAFRGAGITSLTIPGTLTSVANGLFGRCTSLETLVISEGVTKLDNYACHFCRSLTSVSLPSTLTSIGEYAFYSCSALTNIEIPNSVTSIGNSAFDGCSALTTINLLATTPPKLGSYAIPSNVTTINIPSGSLNAYQNASGWSGYASKFVEV